jgi:hypothetical protein
VTGSEVPASVVLVVVAWAGCDADAAAGAGGAGGATGAIGAGAMVAVGVELAVLAPGPMG